mgnify:CR=1 FL=1
MILDRLIKVAQGVLEGSEVDLTAVTPETTLEELGLNSIMMLMLMVGIEDEFSIRFPAERVGELKTIGDLLRIIEESLHAQA